MTANQNAITALNSAIASGKLIKTVATTSTGYTITFSDNTTISLNHGTNGTNGTPGATGPAGATGFTPIIGIDADGYWTVVTTQGGTPARILVGGQPVYAKFTTDQFGANAQGFITINGVATSVYVPIIAYNDVTKKLQITIKNTDGTFTTYNVAVDEDTFLKSDLVSVVSPIGMTKVLINFGYVPSSAAYTASTTTTIMPVTAGPGGPFTVAQALAFAGKTYDDLLRSEGKLPVIINPAQAVLTGYTFEVIKKDGTNYSIQPGAIVDGFSGAFTQFAAAPSNGLYTLPFNPTRSAAATASTAALYPAGYPGGVAGESYELAVRASKGGREVISGYQYAIKVAPDVNTFYEYKAPAANVIDATVAGTDPAIYPWKVYVALGTTKNLLTYYDRTASWGGAITSTTVTNADFFKSQVSIVPAPGNTDVENFISVSGTSVTTGITAATVSNLNNKTVPFKLETFDWRGMYRPDKGIEVVFYSALNNAVSDIAIGTHVLTDAVSPADQKTVMLTSMFTQLDGLGKTELWRNQATNVQVRFYNAAGTVINGTPGVTYQFKDANDFNVGGPNAILTALADVQNVRKIVFTFDETVAVPGSFMAKLEFVDRRAYATETPFKLSMPYAVANPDITTILNNMKEHKANLFDGSLLTVYGTIIPPATLVQTDAPGATFYNLTEAYVNLMDAVKVPMTGGLRRWAFVRTAPTPTATILNPITPLAPVNGTEKFDIFSTSPTAKSLYNTYTVVLKYYHFANVNNAVDVETINVIAKSAIKEGNTVLLTPAAPLPATLQVVNGDVATIRNISDYVRANDYLGNNLNAFKVVAPAVMDPRIPMVAGRPAIAVLNQALDGSTTYAHLVNVVRAATTDANPHEWYITATTNVSTITQDTNVPLTIEITDLFGQKLQKEVTVLVKKN
ncbi:MAG TPA: hypothetical protein DF637_02405 [Rikenellaceae bacterium]|nr:hypothetical protein [Rikenellaceae bacterium]